MANWVSCFKGLLGMDGAKRRSGTVSHETNEIAQTTAAAGSVRATRYGVGGALTGLASVVALMFSAVSLYHSVLKQPELQAHVSQVVHYTRDSGGAEEVFAVPLTIANHGARDGTVLDLELQVISPDGEGSKVFYSAYVVDGAFFVPPGRFNVQERRFERVDRPKTPFAPIAVAGRSSYSGTLLFYRKGKAFPKIVTDKGDYKLKLTMNTSLDSSLGYLDQMLAKDVEPIEIVVGLPYFSQQSVDRGGNLVMKNVAWSKPAEEEQPK
jgi:hypothetical protein